MNLIIARCLNRGIGKNNKLPWFIKEELHYFAKLTIGDGNNAIIMGRKTWDSLPKKPLPNRFNIIISKYNKNIETNYHCHPKVKIINSIDTSKHFIDTSNFNQTFVIGGGDIYSKFLKQGYINKIYESVIQQDYNCDTFIEPFPEYFEKESSINQTYGSSCKYNCSIQYNVWRNNQK
jgi:dihydrofolate reductase